MYDIYDNDFDKAFDEAVEAIERDAKKKHGRLIDADALFEKGTILIPAKYYEGAQIVINAIRNAPTIDAEPTKRGRWVLNERGVYQCECGFVPTMEEKIYYHYCPNCGAKMDESEAEK